MHIQNKVGKQILKLMYLKFIQFLYKKHFKKNK